MLARIVRSYLAAAVLLMAQDSIPGRLDTASGLQPRAATAPRSSRVAGELPAVPVFDMGAVGESRPARAPRSATPVGRLRSLADDVMARGEWAALPDGRALWRLSILSPGAAEMRLHFEDFHAGEGTVWVYAMPGEPAQEYSGGGLFEDGDFWSTTVNGSSVTVEYAPADGLRSESVPFRISEASHLFVRTTALPERAAAPLSLAGSAGDRLADALPSLGAASSSGLQLAACHLDVSCYPDYQRAASGVTRIVFSSGGFAYSCTASLVNTRSGVGTPLLLTASHCISSEAEARSVQANFFYESSACGSSQLKAVETVSGANYMVSASFAGGDYSLIRLLGLPKAPVYFFGLSTVDPALGSRLAGIHHPEGSYKRISFGTRIADQTIFVSDGTGLFFSPADAYYQVDQREGRTEGGSSGSPLLNDRKEIIGILSSGPVFSSDPVQDEILMCAAAEVIDQYGRLSRAFAGLRPYIEDLRPAQIVSPRAGELLPAGAVRFTWTPGVGASEYRIDIGKSPGESDFGSHRLKETSIEIRTLPDKPTPVYVRLSTLLQGNWQSIDYSYAPATGTGPRPSNIVFPAPGAVLDVTAEFRWADGEGVSEYIFHLGDTFGGIEVARRPVGQATSIVISNIPTDGRTLYARLYSRVGSEWQSRDVVYRAASRQSKTVTIRFTNRLAYPVAVLVNERSSFSVGAFSSDDYILPRVDEVTVGWQLIRPVHPVTGLPMGEALSGIFPAVRPEEVASFEATNTVNGRTWFTPVVSNAAPIPYLVEVNSGTSARGAAGAVAAGVRDLAMGYYRQVPGSNVRGFYSGFGYSGASLNFADVAGVVEDSSGIVRVSFGPPGGSAR